MSSPPVAAPLRTERLWLRPPAAGLAAALLDFHRRNVDHFAPWDPPMPAGFLSYASQAQRIEQARLAFGRGEAQRWWLCPLDQPRRIIGTLHLSQISRGVFHSAVLGYSLDQASVGQGLMSEALHAALGHAFSPALGLHRVQAAVRPENQRSLAVLARAGFETIGLARDYLFIDGAWRDHLLLQRTHAGWPVPPAWRRPTDPPRPADNP